MLDVRTHFKPTETFHYTHFSTCRPSEVKKGFIKREALRLLRTLQESVTNFKTHLFERGYPENFIQTALSEVVKTGIKPSGRQKQKLW